MKTKILLLLILMVPFLSKAQSGLKAEYYEGENFEKWILTRMESQINYDWGYDGPAPGKVPGSYFSARWTGGIYAPASGKYAFSAHVDDGVRVWVGNVLVIDAWGLHDSESFKGEVLLTEGKFYPFKVEYYNAPREGEFQLYWTMPVKEEVPGNWMLSQERLIEAKYFVKPAPPVAAKPAVSVKPAPKPAVTPAKPQPPKATAGVPVQPAKKPAAIPLPEILRPEAPPALRSVYFEKSTDVLLPNSVERLEIVINYLKASPASVIELTGHTDVVGDSNSNQKLSEERAILIGNYLKNKGIDAARITTKGLGSTLPLYEKPATENEHSLNRRVEFKVKG